MKKMNKEDARAQIASLQQLRTHWSGVITKHLGLTMTINVAIISYFLKSYIDTLDSIPQFSFLFAMTALTSLIFGLWRLYTHYIDNAIANLYPEFLNCEYKIGIDIDKGTIAYLTRELKNARYFLADKKISHKKKIKFLNYLVKIKRIGTRGHLPIDITILIVQLTMLSLVIIMGYSQINTLNVILLLVGLLGLFLTLLGIFRFQKWLRKNDARRALKKVKD